MIPDGEYKAVVDRIEDTLAALELSDADGNRYSLGIAEDELPTQARHADAVLQVTVAEGELVDETYQPEETTTRKQETQDRFDRLSQRAPRNEDNTTE